MIDLPLATRAVQTLGEEQPLVVTVMINYWRSADTIECLQSLARSTYPNHACVLLNYCDEPDEDFQQAFERLTIYRPDFNRGYTGNNNYGIQKAREMDADWIFILNEDTLLEPDCLSRLVACGSADPAIGMIGPLVYHADEPEVIQSAGGKRTQHWEWVHRGANQDDRGQYAESEPVDWLSGCALLVRTSAFPELGFDERFFTYNEETDLAYRLGQAGWKILFCPKAKIWHKGVQRNYHPGPNVTYYMARNQLLLLQKNRAPFAVRAYHWVKILRTLAAWTVKPRWKNQKEHRRALSQAAKDYLFKKWGKRSG